MNVRSRTDDLSAIAAIGEPIRRSLFDFVANSPDAVSRDDAADQLSIPRATAAFHLDRLVESGLLTAQFARRTGRTGPGAGRPSKLYRRAEEEFSASIPERHYDLAAELLSSAIEEAERTGEPVREALTRVSIDYGRRLGTLADSFGSVLATCGYEPRDDGAGGFVLSNCPFHRLAQAHTDTICQANVALLTGVALGTAEPADLVRFDPGAGRCCVRIVPSDGADGANGAD